MDMAPKQLTRTLFHQMMEVACSCEKMSFYKKSLLLTTKEFEKFQNDFVPVNGRCRGEGMRTRKRIVHLHANPIGKYVEIHVDHGNPIYRPFTGVLHLLFDLLPYIIYCIVKHGKWFVPVIKVHNKKT